MTTKCSLALLIGWATLGGLARGQNWQPIAQPELREQLSQAPPLPLGTLPAPARGVTRWTFQLIPHPDGRTHDALQWYFKSYSGPTWLYACDLGAGRVAKQRFPDRRQIHMHGGLPAPDGRDIVVSTRTATFTRTWATCWSASIRVTRGAR
jgi:hypothetical protein